MGPVETVVPTLPPYSPELNPTEQLWDLIRERWFANIAHKTMQAVEDALVLALRTLESAPDTIRTLAHRTWNTNLNAG